MTIDTSKTYTATIKTDLGTIMANLDAAADPVAVNSFVFLADKKYYNCLTFHRVIPQFMNQTGDPTGTGGGTVGYTVQGAVPGHGDPAVPARLPGHGQDGGRPAGPRATSSSSWPAPRASPCPPGYALFGQVTSGQSVVDAINADGDASDDGTPPKVIHRMLSVTVTSPEPHPTPDLPHPDPPGGGPWPPRLPHRTDPARRPSASTRPRR